MTGVPDVRRLARAVHLDAERLYMDTWRVTGGASVHIVHPASGRCDCVDSTMRPGSRCKHALAVALATLDDDLRAGLRALVRASHRTSRPISSAPKSRRGTVIGRRTSSAVEHAMETGRDACHV